MINSTHAIWSFNRIRPLWIRLLAYILSALLSYNPPILCHWPNLLVQSQSTIMVCYFESWHDVTALTGLYNLLYIMFWTAGHQMTGTSLFPNHGWRILWPSPCTYFCGTLLPIMAEYISYLWILIKVKCGKIPHVSNQITINRSSKACIYIRRL